MIPYNILFGCVAILLALYYYIVGKYNYWRARGVKGPTPLPIVGNFGGIILGKTSVGELLKKIYVEYSEEPLIGIYMGFKPVLIVRDPVLVKDVLIKDFPTFDERGMHVNEKVDKFAINMFAIEAERWRLLRTKFSPTFSSGKLKNMFHLLVQCSSNFGQYLDCQVQQDSIIDCRMISSKFTADAIGICLFGIDFNTLGDKECDFLRLSKKLLEPSTKLFLMDLLKNMLPQVYDLIGYYLADHEAQEFLVKTVIDTVEYRSKNDVIKHDFMDILQDLRKHPEKLPGLVLTDNVLVAQAVTFLLAGFFSTAVTMSHILYELAQNPDMQERLRAEITGELEKTNGVIAYDSIKTMRYMDAIFKETLRKYPPISHLLRQSSKSYTFSGTQVHIPKGQQIWIPVSPVHLDPNIYPNPEIFDPERFSKGNDESMNLMSYLPFGDGPRNCIGVRFAIHQTKVGIVEILKNFEISVCEKTSFEIGKSRTFVLTPKEGMYLRFTKINRG